MVRQESKLLCKYMNNTPLRMPVPQTVTAEREFRHDPVLDRDNMPTGKDHKVGYPPKW